MKELFTYITDNDSEVKLSLKIKLCLDMQLSRNDLVYQGLLSLYSSKITELPDDLHVSDILDIRETNISALPDNLHVGGSLYMYLTNITILPDSLYVDRNIYVDDDKKEYFKRKFPKFADQIRC